MMIPGIMAQRRVVSGGGSPPVSLVGIAATSETFTGTSFTVTVPAGAAAGDTMIAILRCRADRSFSTPAGWTSRLSQVVGTAGLSSGNTRLYILTKDYSGESTVSFTQSTSAAGTATVAVVRGVVGTQGSASGNSHVFSPTVANSMLIAVGVSNNTTSAVASWTSPFTTVGSFKWSASSPYFYGASVATLISGATDLETAAYTWPFDGASPNSNYTVILEILPLP